MGRFLVSGRRFGTPPQKKLLASPAGPREPRRGSRGGLKLAPTTPLGRQYRFKTARDGQNGFWSFLKASLRSFSAPLGSPWGQKVQYVSRFLLFLCVYVYVLKMFKMIPRWSQEHPKGRPKPPKRSPRDTQEDPRTPSGWPPDGSKASRVVSKPILNHICLVSSSPNPPKAAQEDSRTLPRGVQEGPRMAPNGDVQPSSINLQGRCFL